MDFDLVLREEAPAALTATSTTNEKNKFEKWKKANRMALLIMKKAMTESVRGGIPKSDKAKELFNSIAEKFKESDKAETMKFDGVGSIREHNLKMADIAQKLKDLEVPMTDQFLVHMALNSLPPQYGPLKVSYNTQKEKWGMDDLISMCAEEEIRLKADKVDNVANLV